ncbi:MAG: ABC transporter permease [Bacteroidetes bacterium]|nr:ABC transporter permease [Bacteroidota bacterium]MBU1718843.1 ABC transporter permease [Bacteroidota bacterium]
MKRLRGFIIKEFYHIFRDYRTMVILFGLPVVQVLLFGFVLTNEVKDANIAVLDKSKDAETMNIINKLTSSGYFMLNAVLESEDEVEGVFQEGKVKQVVIFEENFAKTLKNEGRARIQLLADASDPNTAQTLVNYTTAVVNTYLAEKAKSEGKQLLIDVVPKMLYNPAMEASYMFVPGVIAIVLMLISSMITSISIAREKELGTMEVLLVSPLRAGQIIIGKVVPYVFLSFLIAATILLVGRFVFGVPINGPLGLLLAESLLFILLALSLGILVSTVSKTQQTAMLISLFALLLPTILLSGLIFPIENMPLLLQYISHAIPAKYFVIILKNIMIKGTGLESVWFETIVLGGITLFFILLSVLNFKKRLE